MDDGHSFNDNQGSARTSSSGSCRSPLEEGARDRGQIRRDPRRRDVRPSCHANSDGRKGSNKVVVGAGPRVPMFQAGRAARRSRGPSNGLVDLHPALLLRVAPHPVRRVRRRPSHPTGTRAATRGRRHGEPVHARATIRPGGAPGSDSSAGDPTNGGRHRAGGWSSNEHRGPGRSGFSSADAHAGCDRRAASRTAGQTGETRAVARSTVPRQALRGSASIHDALRPGWFSSATPSERAH